jgi:predicted DNA-binding transcriptional regulator AlpA
MLHTAQHISQRALDDKAICDLFGISRPTLGRWRRERGFPSPDFYVGPRGFTWESRPAEWAARQPSSSPISGREVPLRAS